MPGLSGSVTARFYCTSCRITQIRSFDLETRSLFSIGIPMTLDKDIYCSHHLTLPAPVTILETAISIKRSGRKQGATTAPPPPICTYRGYNCRNGSKTEAIKVKKGRTLLLFFVIVTYECLRVGTMKTAVLGIRRRALW
jgi:hypothetical protein